MSNIRRENAPGARSSWFLFDYGFGSLRMSILEVKVIKIALYGYLFIIT
jgi:hypothetical protein